MTYTDKSLQPIQPDGSLKYIRGDGALVELKITPPGQPTQEYAFEPTTPISNTEQLVQQVTQQGTIVVPPITLNPAVNAQIRAAETPAREAPGNGTPFVDDRIMDHPAVGGKMTAFMLFYDDPQQSFHNLHKQCLESFINTVPMSRIDLRVGSNQLKKESVEMIEKAVEQGLITKHYRHLNNDYKYPVMREMFFDPTHPIQTKWVMWFDDDSLCTADPQWLRVLAMSISQNHQGREAHMFGSKLVWTVNPAQKAIFERAHWWKNKPWQAANGKPSPNGTKIVFATGGWWAITHEAIVNADIPDLKTGLTHTGGDWQIGAQLYQAGYGLKQFNGQKQFIKTSAVKRRGVTMPTIDKVVHPQVRQVPTQPRKGVIRL